MIIQMAAIFASMAATVLCGRIALLYYQLESYQLDGYFRTLQRNWLRALLPGAIVSLLSCLIMTLLLYTDFTDRRILFGFGLMAFLGGAAWWIQSRLPAKKPLQFTARVKRLLFAFFLCAFLLSTGLLRVTQMLPILLLLPVMSMLVLAVTALVMLPIEVWINSLYLRDAMKRLSAMPDLIKIGITGSYGKTSTKFMLETILRERYNVLTTPGSFNTSMGVTRIIRERLLPSHQVFIAEMGARHRGDIRLLCKLVRPKFGILTSVGPQHLETFHTQETIIEEKFDLARAIPKDGAMVFAADGGLVEALFERFDGPKHLCGLRAEGAGLMAKDIEVGPWGSRFILTDGKEEIECETQVLGTHNISNLLLACTMARVLGMDLPMIARGVSKVRPVEHRLELLRRAGGITVIDDAFNANPVGANAALSVLKAFPGRRIIVTPGFVELGEKESAYNRAFGEYMAECVDIAILVGRRRTEPIAQGLLNKGFDSANLRVVSSLSESSAFLATTLQSGDVVLYENDLPDNYQE